MLECIFRFIRGGAFCGDRISFSKILYMALAGMSSGLYGRWRNNGALVCVVAFCFCSIVVLGICRLVKIVVIACVIRGSVI